MALQFQPNFLQSILGSAPEIDQGPMDLSGIGRNANLAPVAPPISAAPQAQEAPRSSGRRSVLDIIGGLGDVFAKVGGAEAQYQPQVDARTERARAVDLDAMRRQQFDLQQRTGEQGLKLGDQKYQAGEMELDDAQRGVLGQAVRGLDAVYQQGGAPALQKAWPMLRDHLKIPPEQAQLFEQSLTADPQGTISALHAALTDPAKTGSQPAQLQIAAMLDKRDPTGKLSQQYVQNLASGMDANEAARIGLQRETLSARSRYQQQQLDWAKDPRNPSAVRATAAANKPGAGGKGGPPSAEALASGRDVLGQLKTELQTLKANGGINASGQTAAQRAGAFAKENLPLVERLTSPQGFSARQRMDGLLTQGVFTMIPLLTGATLGGKSFDAKAEMDNLKRVIATSSDYDASLRAISSFERKLDRLEFPAQGGGTAPRSRQGGTLTPRRNSAPAAGGWKVIGVK